MKSMYYLCFTLYHRAILKQRFWRGKFLTCMFSAKLFKSNFIKKKTKKTNLSHYPKKLLDAASFDSLNVCTAWELFWPFDKTRTKKIKNTRDFLNVILDHAVSCYTATVLLKPLSLAESDFAAEEVLCQNVLSVSWECPWISAVRALHAQLWTLTDCWRSNMSTHFCQKNKPEIKMFCLFHDSSI